MTRVIVARWQDWQGTGLQHLVLTQAVQEITAEASVIGSDGARSFAVHFRVRCDGAWRVRHVTAGIVGDPHHIELTADGAGHWRDAAGHALPDLAGAIDVDLPVTPFTNTLPIRRLGLGAGQSADLRVAYIVLPGGQVSADPQRYVCLEPMRRYRYESLDSDFERELQVDADGLVIDYPGLFRRIA